MLQCRDWVFGVLQRVIGDYEVNRLVGECSKQLAVVDYVCLDHPFWVAIDSARVHREQLAAGREVDVADPRCRGYRERKVQRADLDSFTVQVASCEILAESRAVLLGAAQ